MIKTVDEIVAAIEKLDHKDFFRLRQKMDRLEKKLWDAELASTTEEMKKAKVTDKDIDRMVTRRRYENCR